MPFPRQNSRQTVPKAGVEHYGLTWPSDVPLPEIIATLIRMNGKITDPDGRMVEVPLFTLYRDLQSVLWPEDDHHEWSDLMLKTMIEERITTVMGPKDCGKTRGIAKFAMVDYLCHPDDTLILISSTTIQGLELRVWGDLKTLFDRAKSEWPGMPGNPLESRHGIFTDKLNEDCDVRDMRKGIICIAMRDSSGQWVGLKQYTGIKQKRRRLLADEAQFYHDSYLSTLANLDKGNFKGIFVGNPIGELDPLDKLAEPVNGWDSQGEIVKTTTWKNRWGGITINLVGSDSPAIHYPGRYTYLTDQEDIDRITQRFGKESFEFWNQAMGIRKPGIMARRVYTRDMALQFGSQEDVVWGTGKTTKVYGLDAAYGGDRCVGIVGEFGLDQNGHQILAFSEPTVIPIKVYPKSTPIEDRLLPEDQIADQVKRQCEADGIPPQNVFFDATGRGSLGTAFARIWSAKVNPIEFGGPPTMRPVCNDLYIEDQKTRTRRLKTAKEHYSKFVTELWFALRYAGEGRQLRCLPNSVLDELSRREWHMVKNDRYELETKAEYKDTYGSSPDNADAAVTMLEGARRLGFYIARLAIASPTASEDDRWKDRLRDRAKRLQRSYELDYMAA